MDSINVTTEILSLAEARRRLEVIKPEVERLMDLSRQIQQMHALLKGFSGSGKHPPLLTAGLERLRVAWRESLQRINDQGATVKDPATGLMDFYTWHGDELVFLCWHHGEETIEAWHGLDEGFAGRKSVESLREP